MTGRNDRTDKGPLWQELAEAVAGPPGAEEAEALRHRHLASLEQAVAVRGDPFGRADWVRLEPEEGAALQCRVSALPAVLGRDAECDLVCGARGVSARHCRFAYQAPFVTVTDLDSRNGVHINGQAVTSEFLCEGDRLVVGAMVFRVVRA